MKTQDICERKHGGAETSQDAFKHAEASIKQTQQEILDLLQHLTLGITSKEYAAIVGKGINAISGRFSELAKMGRIHKTGDRRDGCAVWKVTV